MKNKIKKSKFWARQVDEKKIKKLLNRKRGVVYLFTGDGEGKSTAALGLALRALGHGKSVVVIQFMKGRKYAGEYQVQNILKNFEVYQYGKEQFVDLEKPDKKDYQLASEGFEFAKQVMKRRPDVLILDEINLIVDNGLLKSEEVLELINETPNGMVLILTGRNAPKSFVQTADIVSDVQKIKHIFY